ncbi:hypothetical protein HYX17_04985 [Candidatus Woesearchaeota archaeon]|nr:hypothetical protein [Candidatus Woesearchaeota archaeon]
MKKGIFILILFIITIPYALSLDVTLSSPVLEGNNVTLKCTVTYSISEGINKLDLWNDVTGTFSLNQSNLSEITSGVEYSFEKLIGLSDNTYSWNCNAFNSSDSEFMASSNSSFTISSNNPPSISPIGSITIDEDIPFSIILSDNVSDDNTLDSDLKFTFTNSNPSILDITIENSTNNLSFFPILNKNGQSTINITVWDSSLNQNSDEFILTISSVNDAPTNKTNALDDLSWLKNKNESIDLTDYFTDPDGDSLTYYSSNPAHVNIIIDNSTGTAILVPETDFIGEANVYFIAYDNDSNFTSNTINLTIRDSAKLNSAPKIDSYNPATLTLDLEKDIQQSFSITKSDAENDNLTVRWYLNSKLVSQEDSYTFSSNDLKTHNLEVVVSDGSLTDSVEWLVNIKEKFEQSNFTPVITKEEKCGNNIVDVGENCASCPNDVVCKEDEICINQKCTIEKESNIAVILIVISIILLLAIIIAFYLHKKKQHELGLTEPRLNETQKMKLVPPADIEDFYKEPKIKPQIEVKKQKDRKRTNIVILRAYMKQAFQRGYSKEAIKKNLLKTGWKEQDIDLVLNEFK